MRRRINQLTNELLERALTHEEFDLISEYALPVHTTIIAELIGVPSEDRYKFHRWSAKVVSLSPTAGPEMLFAFPPVIAFLRYIRKLMKHAKHIHKCRFLARIWQDLTDSLG